MRTSNAATTGTRLQGALAEAAGMVEETLDLLLPRGDVPEARLFEAMSYATLGGGKRLRAFMVLTTSRLFHVADPCALRVAAAVEMIHAYSLVHDDLPAMDDDDMRRGRPSCHRRFDEATAILAGDALLTQTFEVLTDEGTHADPKVRCELVSALASAAGPCGMVGGQMFDIASEHQPLDIAGVTRLQRLKTGKLIAFSCEAGAILGKAPMQARHALLSYAHDLGLAFQIVDDILDVEGTVDEVGKRTRKDVEAGKATFVSVLGLDRARAQARMLADQACAHLDVFEERADLLRDAARFVVERRA